MDVSSGGKAKRGFAGLASHGLSQKPGARTPWSSTCRSPNKIRRMSSDARRKIQPLAALSRRIARAHAQGQRIVFTNGCFDLLHAGHVTLLERARGFGDLLVVGINSDRSVKALKGPTRPIINQRNRAYLLAALSCVDYVTIFDDPTPQRLVEQLVPDVLVKGADWGSQKIVGGELVRRHGGRVVRMPLVKGLSTSKVIEQIRGSS